MRDHLVLHINGARHEVRGADALLSLSDFLRTRLHLTGTKIVCSEGDCGACTTLIGRPNEAGDALAYHPIDSCIQFVFQLNGAHVVTVEGLRPDGALNPVQQAMIDCHGSQCGFCTPGFVMAMTGLLDEAACGANGCSHKVAHTNGEATANGAPHDHDDPIDFRRGLTGNLCRCTGYTPILDAALQATQTDYQRLNDLYPPAKFLSAHSELKYDAIEIEATRPITGERQRVACPANLDDALAFLAANPDARIIAGATDVGVRANKSGSLPNTILDLNRIAELDALRVELDAITTGARTSWTALLAACEHALPELARILSVFGAPQIRHVGTIGGNIANASPIADSLPALHVLGATLTLASAAGRRDVNINSFYLGYKKLDLKPGELIAQIHIPLPAPGELFRLYKVSRRRDLDISTFTAAIRMKLRGESVENSQIAFGGVGPIVLRAPKTEQFLQGQPFTEQTFAEAAKIAATEVTPISDVRGAAAYRTQLTQNILMKFYHQRQAELAPA